MLVLLFILIFFYGSSTCGCMCYRIYYVFCFNFTLWRKIIKTLKLTINWQVKLVNNVGILFILIFFYGHLAVAEHAICSNNVFTLLSVCLRCALCWEAFYIKKLKQESNLIKEQVTQVSNPLYNIHPASAIRP
jgi:hypothetical protein